MTILLVTNDDARRRARRPHAAPRDGVIAPAYSCRSASIGASLTARHVG